MCSIYSILMFIVLIDNFSYYCEADNKTFAHLTELMVKLNDCPDQHFKCDQNKCIPFSQKCARLKKCHDGSDELGCHETLGNCDFETQSEKSCGWTKSVVNSMKDDQYNWRFRPHFFTYTELIGPLFSPAKADCHVYMKFYILRVLSETTINLGIIKANGKYVSISRKNYHSDEVGWRRTEDVIKIDQPFKVVLQLIESNLVPIRLEYIRFSPSCQGSVINKSTVSEQVHPTQSTVFSSTSASPYRSTVSSSTTARPSGSTVFSSTSTHLYKSTISNSTSARPYNSTVFSNTSANPYKSTTLSSISASPYRSTVSSSTTARPSSSTVFSSTSTHLYKSTISNSTSGRPYDSTVSNSTSGRPSESIISNSTSKPPYDSKVLNSTSTCPYRSTISNSTSAHPYEPTISSSSETDLNDSVIGFGTDNNEFVSPSGLKGQLSIFNDFHQNYIVYTAGVGLFAILVLVAFSIISIFIRKNKKQPRPISKDVYFSTVDEQVNIDLSIEEKQPENSEEHQKSSDHDDASKFAYPKQLYIMSMLKKKSMEENKS